jgi:hypothetical protein
VRDNQHTEPGVFILSGDIPAGLGQDIDIQHQKRDLEHAEGKQDVVVHALFPSLYRTEQRMCHIQEYNKTFRGIQHRRQETAVSVMLSDVRFYGTIISPAFDL